MSVTGKQDAKTNLDEGERRLRARGNQHVSGEELLAELVQLVESSGHAREGSQRIQTESGPNRTETGPLQSLQMPSRLPPIDVPPRESDQKRTVEAKPPPVPPSDDSVSSGPDGTGLARGRQPGAWTFRLSALVLVGAAVIGSIVWLKRDEPGRPMAPPAAASAEHATAVQPRGDSTAAAASGAAITPPQDVALPTQVQGASPEVRPIDDNARASLDHQPSSDLRPAAANAAGRTAAAPADGAPATPANSPTGAAPTAASAPVASQSPKPASAASLTTEPAEVGAPVPSGESTQPSPPNRPTAKAFEADVPLPPVRPTSKAATKATGVRPSAPKPELPTKLSNKSATHVVAGKAEAPAPATAQAAPLEPPAPAPQPNPNPVVHAFNTMVGAVAGLNPFAAR